jgi:hypothetical protein
VTYRTLIANDRIRVLDDKGTALYAFENSEEGQAKAKTFIENRERHDKRDKEDRMASGESVAAMSEEERLQILTDEQEKIKFDSKDPASREAGMRLIDGRIDALEKIVREARLRLQVNTTTKNKVVDDMSEAEKAEWREKSKKYKVKADSEGGTGRTKSSKPTGSPREKAIKSRMNLLGLTYEEAEKEYDDLIAKRKTS